MASTIRMPVRDHSDETSRVSVRAADPLPSDAQITALFDAIVDVTLGNVEKSVLVTEEDKDAGTTGVPANAFAQREIKWLVRYTDNVTGGKYRFEIPTADLQFVVQGTDFMDLTSSEGAALKTAIQDAISSPDGNFVTVDSVEFVGRNT